jgi:chemotaxis protein histidine kinase CheA
VSGEPFTVQLDALRAAYRSSLPAKLAEIHRLWTDLSSSVAVPGRLGDLRRELHTLAGSAKTFGVAGVGEIAAAAESLLEPFCEQSMLPDSTAAAELTRLIDALGHASAAR